MKKFFFLMMCVISLVSVANDGNSKYVASNAQQLTQRKSSSALSIRYYFYRYNLPLSKINQALANFKFNPVNKQTQYPYINKISGIDLDILNKSFSQIFTPINNGKTWCVVNGSPGIVSTSIIGNSKQWSNAMVSFYAYTTTNSNVSVVLKTFDNSSGVDTLEKITARLDNIINNRYIIMSQKKHNNLFGGQLILVEFGK